MHPKVVPTESAAENGSPSADCQDLYQLLGLAPFESNAEVISSRVRDLMREARKYQLGPYAARTQTHLETLASATACLLDPLRKEEYDDELRRRYGLPEIAVVSTYIPSEAAPIAPIDDPVLLTPVRQRPRRSLRALWLGIFLIGGACAYWMLPAKIPGRTASRSSAREASRQDARPLHHARAGVRRRTADLSDRKVAFARDSTATGDRANDRAAGDESPVGNLSQPEFNSSADLSGERSPVDIGEPGSQPTEISTGGGQKEMFRTAARDAAKRPIPTDSASAGSPEGGAATGGQSPSASQAPPVELTLNPSEVLQELRGFRLKRNPAQRLSATPHAFSTKRIVELVRYARSAFRDDRHFQRQLDQETTALKRLDPQLKDLLPDSHR